MSFVLICSSSRTMLTISPGWPRHTGVRVVGSLCWTTTLLSSCVALSLPRSLPTSSCPTAPTRPKILRHYLPSTEIVVFEQATDPKRFTLAEGKESCWDVLFVGAADPLRRDVLEFLFFEPARRMPQLAFGLYGLGWEKSSEYPTNVVYGGWIDNDSLAEAYARAKVVVHGAAKPLRPCELVVNRVHDIMAAGTVVLADRTKGLERAFTPGEQIALASDADEATAWIRSLVSDRERRRRIASADRNTVLQHHTWAHRVDELKAIYSALERIS